MPLYEYACRPCRKEFELLVRGEEKPQCPECGNASLEKLLSVTAAPSISGQGQAGGFCGPKPEGTCGLPQCGTGGCMGL